MWPDTAGWISMNCTNFGTCGVVDYGVDLDYSGSGNGTLTGWAWSETFGWVCFGSTCPDAIQNPEGSAQNYAELREYVDDGTPTGRNWQFYGWARILNMGELGWISLNCYNVGQAACQASRGVECHVDDHRRSGCLRGDGAGRRRAGGNQQQGGGVP